MRIKSLHDSNQSLLFWMTQHPRMHKTVEISITPYWGEIVPLRHTITPLLSNSLCRLRNKDAWWGFTRRFFRTKSVMGRLWDDHFRDLGYLPKFYGVQDARFIPRMDFTHICSKKLWEIQKTNIPSSFEKENGCFPKNTKTKMTAMARSIDSNTRFPICYWKINKNRRIGTNGGSIMHPYFWLCKMTTKQTSIGELPMDSRVSRVCRSVREGFRSVRTGISQ